VALGSWWPSEDDYNCTYILLHTVTGTETTRSDNMPGGAARWGRSLGSLTHGESLVCLESPRFHTVIDGASIDGAVHRPDASSMQSVRHTPACLSVGGVDFGR
jgi:hypothetical protein